MASRSPVSILFVFYVAATVIYAVDVEKLRTGLKSDMMMGFLRAMVNQTKGDTLNLPANASSIRENITDNFSCENRTYGYYADVENECQIFHVCLPSQTSSGRNTTYKWSFICPNETIFNQDVLTCTRPRDSIDCEDSPMYYDRNEEMYKTNDTTANTDTNNQMNNNKESTTARSIKNRRKPAVNNRKQNLVIDNSISNANKYTKLPVNDDMKQNNEDKKINSELINMHEALMEPSEIETQAEEIGDELPIETVEMMMNERIAGERRLRSGRRIGKRGSFRFKADIGVDK